MALTTVRLTSREPISDRKLLACKVNGMKTPKPRKSHPWRGWVSVSASKTPPGKKRAQFLAEAKERAKKFK